MYIGTRVSCVHVQLYTGTGVRPPYSSTRGGAGGADGTVMKRPLVEWRWVLNDLILPSSVLVAAQVSGEAAKAYDECTVNAAPVPSTDERNGRTMGRTRSEACRQW